MLVWFVIRAAYRFICMYEKLLFFHTRPLSSRVCLTGGRQVAFHPLISRLQVRVRMMRAVAVRMLRRLDVGRDQVQ